MRFLALSPLLSLLFKYLFHLEVHNKILFQIAEYIFLKIALIGGEIFLTFRRFLLMLMDPIGFPLLL